MRDAFGRDGYVWEGIRDAFKGGHVETRHFHGDMMHDHIGGQAQHEHVPAPPPNYAKKVYSLLTLIVVCWVGWHPVHAEMTKANPPAACQLLGGTWNIWSGWSCN